MSDEPPSSSTTFPEASSSSQAPFVTHQVSKEPLGIEQPIILSLLCTQDSSSTEFSIFECSTWSVQVNILAEGGDLAYAAGHKVGHLGRTSNQIWSFGTLLPLAPEQASGIAF